jgi:hypothetical protein
VFDQVNVSIEKRATFVAFRSLSRLHLFLRNIIAQPCFVDGAVRNSMGPSKRI